jgi:hypothetical protein
MAKEFGAKLTKSKKRETEIILASNVKDFGPANKS